MKKFISFNLLMIIALSILVFSCKKDDDKEEPTISKDIYEGSLINPSSAELQDFLTAGYHTINGNLELNKMVGFEDFSEFINLKEVTGSLIINQNAYLESFDGLESLKTVGGDFVFDGMLSGTPSLYSIESLDNLKTIGGDLIIQNSVLLNDISGFNRIETIGGDLKIINLLNVAFIGLGSLNTVGNDVVLYDLPKLSHLMGLGRLANIGNNFTISDSSKSKGNRLRTLQGLEAVASVGGEFYISNNVVLSNFCALTNLLANNGLNGDLHIETNLYNPSLEQIVGGECELD